MVHNKDYTILVVEDNAGDFLLVESFLYEHLGSPEIIHAKSFGAATAVLGYAENKPDIILLDLSLPDLTGQELIERILSISNHTPVIVLTGLADFDFAVKSLSLGATDYLRKDDLTSNSLYKSIVYSIERTKNLADLRESEKRYSDVFHFSPLPMWILDVDSLKLLDVNQATVNEYGFSRQELLSMTLLDISPEEDVPEMKKAIEIGRNDPGTLDGRIVVHRKKNGERRNVEIQVAPFYYKGKPTHIVIATDITDKLAYLNAIKSQNEHLKEIAWMQSHVVRAPLARIMGLVSILQVSNDDNEKEELLSYLNTAANELDGVVRKITDKTKEIRF